MLQDKAAAYSKYSGTYAKLQKHAYHEMLHIKYILVEVI